MSVVEMTDHKLQAAHVIISELVNEKLGLIAHILGLEERAKIAEARVKELEAQPMSLE